MQDKSSDKTRSSQATPSDLSFETVQSADKPALFLKSRRNAHLISSSMNVIAWALGEDIERIKDKHRG